MQSSYQSADVQRTQQQARTQAFESSLPCPWQENGVALAAAPSTVVQQHSTQQAHPVMHSHQ
jgi:hypothetical protein